MGLPDYPLPSCGIKEGCRTVTDKTAIKERRKVEEATLLKRVVDKGGVGVTSHAWEMK